jgi:hypothetical protein
MSVKNNHPRNQHYVPQFILRNFRSREDDFVWCYDKTNKKVFETNISNIASESYFYDWIKGNPEHSLESKLSEIESETALIISKILKDSTLSTINHEEKQKLSHFISIQLLRTKNQLEKLKDFQDVLKGFLQMPIDTNLPVENLKTTFLSMLTEAEDFVPILMDKFWYLLSSENTFLISDNPVGFQNIYNQTQTRGTLGFKSKGIEIYLPLSKNIVLCLFCRDVYDKTKYHASDDSTINDFLRQLNSEVPVKCNSGNIENINSLQVLSSERFIFSSSNDFWLVEDMLKNNPELKDGPRLGYD